MPLPVHAQVSAAPNFAATLQQVHAFFDTQDPHTGAQRLAQLKAELREMTAMLAWSPACGRAARFLNTRSVQARVKAAAVAQLAAQAGLPHLREYVLSHHVVLYAHSDTEVVLLALKHHRQLTYHALR
ncbi:MAG: type II toxin-antitoxin system RelE/ParE family toxin [Rhodoferax sp.]|nr:type II toxin-antitoxin system RelE/ParE family toxin [Rhodoferax sp.]